MISLLREVLATVTPGIETPSYEDTTCVPGRKSTYSVRARNDAGFGGSSITSAIRKLGTPNVGASDGDYPNHINVTWSQIEGAVSYHIYRADQPNGVKDLVRTSYDLVPPLSWSDYAVTAEQTYYYFVQAVGEDEDGPLSLPNGGFTIVLDPVELIATDGEYPDSVKLVWGEEPSADRYHIYRSLDDTMAGAVMIQDLPFTVLTWSDTAATGSPWDDARYYFVKPYTGLTEGLAGQGDYGFRALSIPANVAATQGTNAAHSAVSWDAVNYATRYKVFRSDSPIDPAPAEVGEVAAPLTSYNDPAPGWSGTEGVHFYYYVCALHTGPDTERSTISASAEGWRGIGIPQNVSATDGTHTDRVTISWDAVAQAELYTIYREGAYLDEVPTGVTTYDDSTAVGGTTYSYTVSAWAADGEGAQSAPDDGHVNIAPVAAMTSNPDPAEGEPPLMVEFNASASSDADGTIARYDWDWEGDGTYDLNDDSPVQSHEYVFGGEYTCTVRVWDDHGAIAFATIPVLASSPTWMHTWGGSDIDYLGYSDLAVADDGNVYCAGITYSYGVGAGDALIMKYSPSGTLRWAKTWGGSNADGFYAVRSDSSGNIYAYGATYSLGFNGDAIILKYAPDGTLLWQKTWGGNSPEQTYGFCLDGDGNIIIAGSSQSFTAPTFDWETFIVKFSPAGDLLWQKTWGGSGHDYTQGITADVSGNIYLVGYTYSFGAGDADMSILKFASDGSLLWQKTWGGDGFDYAVDVALDAIGGIYVVGNTASYGQGSYDACLLKLDADGLIQWASTVGNYEHDLAYGIAIDSGGYIWLSGYVHRGDFDVVIYKYDFDGNLLMQRGWGGGPREEAVAICARGGTLYLAGYGGNNTGSFWTPGMIANYQDGTETTPTGNEASPSGNVGTPSGTETSPTGVEDTGGGDKDCLIMKIDQSAL